MKYLVTGGTGFVGSHILEFLSQVQSEKTNEITIFATRRYHLSRRDKVLDIQGEINWVDCDITDPVAVNKLFQRVNPDFCLHMAAESFVSPSWDHPNRFMSVNYNGTVNILEAMKNFAPNCKILIPGSGEEYGYINENELPITEETTLRPVNPYAVTKIAQDLISYVYFKSYGLNVIRLRTFNHEGPRREHVFGIASYCYQIAKMEQGLQELTLRTGDIGDKRNFTHVKDVVNAYFLALQKIPPGELFLIGSESNENVATFEEVIGRLEKMSTLDKKIKIEKVVEYTRPTSVPFLITDASKFAIATGWSPNYSLDEILLDTLSYWRNRVKINPKL
jgi:GDP-4-dehydro-6-deoxy-D-mannose reductase